MLMLLATAALGEPMGLMTNRYSPVSSENRPGIFSTGFALLHDYLVVLVQQI